MVTAEIEIDPQHGPVVKVTHDGTTTSVYLMDETAIVTTLDGRQYGLDVSGPWHAMKAAMAHLAESA